MRMANNLDSDFDEDAAMEARWHSLGRDAAKREHDRQLRGYPRNVALEKWGQEIEEMTIRDMQARESRARRGKPLRIVRPKENQPK
jgi:hypothetical protein